MNDNIYPPFFAEAGNDARRFIRQQGLQSK